MTKFESVIRRYLNYYSHTDYYYVILPFRHLLFNGTLPYYSLCLLSRLEDTENSTN
jgi:hypothetical protein